MKTCSRCQQDKSAVLKNPEFAEPPITELEKFVRLVESMRQSQKDYFRTRSTNALGDDSRVFDERITKVWDAVESTVIRLEAMK